MVQLKRLQLKWCRLGSFGNFLPESRPSLRDRSAYFYISQYCKVIRSREFQVRISAFLVNSDMEND